MSEFAELGATAYTTDAPVVAGAVLFLLCLCAVVSALKLVRDQVRGVGVGVGVGGRRRYTGRTFAAAVTPRAYVAVPVPAALSAHPHEERV